MKKVLLIEDNEECRRTLDFIIRHIGYEVIQPESGREGITRAASKYPDLIFISLAGC